MTNSLKAMHNSIINAVDQVAKKVGFSEDNRLHIGKITNSALELTWTLLLRNAIFAVAPWLYVPFLTNMVIPATIGWLIEGYCNCMPNLVVHELKPKLAKVFDSGGAVACCWLYSAFKDTIKNYIPAAGILEVIAVGASGALKGEAMCVLEDQVNQKLAQQNPEKVGSLLKSSHPGIASYAKKLQGERAQSMESCCRCAG